MPRTTLIIGLLVGTGIPLAGSITPTTALSAGTIATEPVRANSPLAPSLQGQPVVVEIYASWCGACQTIKPVLESLRRKEGKRVHWVRFDVTNSTNSKLSAAQAKELGLQEFYQNNRSQTSLVSIINPETGTTVSTFRAQPKLDPYVKAIQTTRAMLSR